MNMAPAGDRALLVELGEVTAAELHAAAARVRALPGVAACIPGHSSLYVICDGAPAVQPIREAVEAIDAAGDATAAPGRLHRIRVQFDGPDLPELLARVRREDFLARIPTLRLTARYLGFRGGFAYLDGWPDEWAMPRRPTSRPVERGTFAIAGNVAGFYPIDTPGGWNLLGHTDAELEHVFRPGDEIVLEAGEVAGRPPRKPKEVARSAYAELIASPLVRIVTAPDWTNLERGLPAGGPFDDVAAAIAGRAVEGNVELWECAMSGPRLRFHRDAVTAWCGPGLDVRVQRVRAGEELAIGRIAGGLRGYLAIGEREGVVAASARGERHVIGVRPGPHDTGLREVLCEVTPQLDRVGIRLRPLQPIDVEVPASLRSIGMQCGTVQLHPDGSLVAMGPDHPVTGGYLQPMTVIASERWKLAQLTPGERVVLKAQPPY